MRHYTLFMGAFVYFLFSCYWIGFYPLALIATKCYQDAHFQLWLIFIMWLWNGIHVCIQRESIANEAMGNRSISWLLMPWFLASQGHQQPLYCLRRIKGPLSCMMKYRYRRYDLCVNNWLKIQLNLYFVIKNGILDWPLANLSFKITVCINSRMWIT